MTVVRFSIEFLSDWHVGTGGGRHGHLDRVYDRDDDGHPFVGAKALAGLLRDRMSAIALGLDDGVRAAWSELADVLLGSEPARSVSSEPDAPRPSCLVIDAARLSPSVKVQLRSRAGLLRALSVERPGVRLDEFGTAMDDHLRFVELAPVGVRLHGEVRLPAGAPAAAVALVAVSLADIRAVGGGRRRGHGRCAVTIDGDPVAVLAAADATAARDAAAQLSAQRADAASGTFDAATGTLDPSGTTRWFHLDVTTLGPVILRRDVRGNVVNTHLEIPGSVLIAALASRAPVAVRRAVAAGLLRFTNAVPAVDGVPAVPVPLSYHAPKTGDGETAVNLLRTIPPADAQLRQVRGVRVVGTGSEWQAVRVATVVRSHNVLDDELQRPTSELGGLFSARAIAPGLGFVAQLAIDESALQLVLAECGAASLQELLGGERRIGTSRKDDYGRVRVEVRDVHSDGQQSTPTPNGSTAILLLTSDALVADQRGRLSTRVSTFVERLSQAVGLQLEAVSKPFARSMRTESWHGAWMSARPTLCGVATGSVIEVRSAEGSLSDQDRVALAALGRSGVGMRTAEGFGRFEVDHPLATAGDATITTGSADAVSPNQEAVAAEAMSPADAQMLQRLDDHAWGQLIEERVSIAVGRGVHLTALGLADSPGRSQLGALRAAVRRNDPDAALSWWNHMRETPSRVQKWSKKSVDVIGSLLAGTTTPWDLLEIDAAAARAISGEAASEALGRHARLASLALIAAASRAAQHDAREDDEA